jgi:oligopeptide transport system ATP-binding protein
MGEQAVSHSAGCDPVVSVQAIRKVFTPRRRAKGQPTVAVDDISFDLAPGSSLGIVGESGSGKTTLARMLVGLEAPTSGRILIDGREVRMGTSGRERRERARRIQMVFQDPYTSLDPTQEIGACLDEVLRLLTDADASARAARVVELLELVGLQRRHVHALPSALSGGQRQRVAIARCLAANASILILDEAVSALDVSVQSQVLNLLADLRIDAKLTYLFISHDLAVVRQLCDEVLVMRRGRCVERGATDTVLSNPQHDYTRLLLDSVPRLGWTPERINRTRQELDRA